MSASKSIRRGSDGVLRATVVAALTVALGGCGAFGWMKSKFGGGSAEAAAAPAAGAAPPAAPEAGDAVPRIEPLHPTANNWYGANGRLYRPFTDDREFTERGRAGVYEADREGKPTASGEPYAARAMTAAHSRLPIPSYARVTNLANGKSAIVRINDRGAYDRDEAIELSAAAARKLSVAKTDEVEVTRLTSAQITAMAAQRPAPAPATPAPAPARAPAPAAAVVPQPAPAPAETAPLQPVAPAPAPVPAAAPAAAPVVPAAAPGAAPATPVAPMAAAAPGAAQRTAPPAPRPPVRKAAPAAPGSGGWSVQVASMAVASVADAVRARVAQQLAQGAPEVPAPRVERHGNRSYVLVGAFADKASAEALAERLRAVLRQDVVVERR